MKLLTQIRDGFRVGLGARPATVRFDADEARRQSEAATAEILRHLINTWLLSPTAELVVSGVIEWHVRNAIAAYAEHAPPPPIKNEPRDIPF